MQEDYWYDFKATLIRNTEISAATDEGEKRGRVKEKVKIEKMIDLGDTIEKISIITGLTKEEIEKIKKIKK